MTDSHHAAAALANEDLGNGWFVQELIPKHIGRTGGNFSHGYRVLNKETGDVCFLKALDFSSAHGAADVSRELQALTAAYNHERDILAKCGNDRLSRVLTPLVDGTHDAGEHFGDLRRVPYLIFELAEGDIRKYTAELEAFDLAWCIRSLHHSATGLMQLHSRNIVHHDVKPSNILTFGERGSKISDLGEAFDPEIPGPSDTSRTPGDHTYAPPELFYGLIQSEGLESRKAADLYSLGGLIFFHFLGISPTTAMIEQLKRDKAPLSLSDYTSDLSFWRNAFNELLEDLDRAVAERASKVATDLLSVARELCEPDPGQRGDPKARAAKHRSSYSLESYVSKLNLLARRIEMSFR